MSEQPTTAERVQEAIRRHQANDLDAAEPLYRGVLADQPGNVDALHFLGLLRHQQGRDDEAIELIQQALAARPDYVDALINLGNLHKLAQRLPEASDCYSRALDLHPNHPIALKNVALILEARGQIELAMKVHLGMLYLFPDAADVAVRCGGFLRRHGKNAEHVGMAAFCIQRAYLAGAKDRETRRELGMLFYILNRIDDAREVYRQWIADMPDDPVAQHMFAASGGTGTPDRAAADYVRTTFDAFADNFDELLVENLNYVAPQRLVAALARHLPPPAEDLAILDAGCGTGLCGPLLRPYARQLCGVDLSPRMLVRAKERGYDQLTTSDLITFLAERAQAWDCVVSADTFVYLGDLRAVATAAAVGVRPRGWFSFTLEASADPGDRVELGPSGRFLHSATHVRARLEEAGFEAIDILADQLRTECSEPVNGWVVVARRRE